MAPKTVGQLKATTNLYDGVGCIDMNAPKMSEKLGTNAGLHLQGAASLEMTVKFQATDASTVELWFRRPSDSTVPPGSLVYLYTMSALGDEEAMSIYIDTDNKLKCAPFGRSQPDFIMIYEDADPTATTKWQYVQCQYKLERTVMGRYLEYRYDYEYQSHSEYEEKLFDRRSVLTHTYTLGLGNSDFRNKNYVSAEKWTIMIGNDLRKSLSIDMLIRNVHVWTKFLSPTDSFQYLFTQPYVGNGLVVSIPLLDGDFEMIRNRAAMNRRNDYMTEKAVVTGGKYLGSVGALGRPHL